jgi:hypothetical protein
LDTPAPVKIFLRPCPTSIFSAAYQSGDKASVAGDERDVLSRAEFEAALLALTAAEKMRLKLIAKWWTSWTSFQWDDLLQEAIFRSCRGTRKCPRGIYIVTFPDNVMRSIRSEWMDSWDDDHDPELDPDDAPVPPFAGGEPAEGRLISKVRHHLSGDEDALQFLDGLLNEIDRNEFMERFGWTTTRYETTRKRFNRKLAELGRLLRNGEKRSLH